MDNDEESNRGGAERSREAVAHLNDAAVSLAGIATTESDPMDLPDLVFRY